MTARCQACDQAWPHLTLGDGEHSLAACGACRRVVNPRSDRFRLFDPVHCPNCQECLDGQSFFFSRLSGPLYPCPWCGAEELVMTTELHFSMRSLPDPEVGRQVQVRTLTEQHAHLHQGIWPIAGQPPALHWVEATVTDEGLRYDSSLTPWVEPRQQHILIEVVGQRKPWLRLDLAALVQRFSTDPREAWLSYSLLADPVGVTVELDESAQAMRIQLAHAQDQLEWYLSYLAECFEELGGEYWDGHAWTKATLALSEGLGGRAGAGSGAATETRTTSCPRTERASTPARGGADPSRGAFGRRGVRAGDPTYEGPSAPGHGGAIQARRPEITREVFIGHGSA